MKLKLSKYSVRYEATGRNLSELEADAIVEIGKLLGPNFTLRKEGYAEPELVWNTGEVYTWKQTYIGEQA